MSKVQPSSEFMAVIEFQILPRWFELDNRTQRDIIYQLGAVMERYSSVQCRWFDADAWTSELSDFVICEFENLHQYNELWSELRRHPFLATPYAKITHILMGMELEIEGLAQIADDPEFSALKIEIEQANLERPPETGKPQKPTKSPRLQRPPSTTKPSKPKLEIPTKDTSTAACHFCGHQIKRKAKFCSRCGTPHKS